MLSAGSVAKWRHHELFSLRHGHRGQFGDSGLGRWIRTAWKQFLSWIARQLLTALMILLMLRAHGRLLLRWRIFDSGFHVVIGLLSHKASYSQACFEEVVVQFVFQFMLYPA